MPLQLPNLDDRTYSDLLEEALPLIPALSPDWTNHNPSDPGITLVELLAYLSEMLIYRLNRVTDDNVSNFLKLLNGPGWVEPARAERLEIRHAVLQREIRDAVLRIRERYRAVTRDDFEFLSTAAFGQFLKRSKSSLPQVARAHCVPQRNVDARNEDERLVVRQDHVSVVILPALPEDDKNPNPQPGRDLVDALLAFLDERRILTTRLHVCGPVYAPVAAELVIARKTDVPEEKLKSAIKKTLENLFSPRASGKKQAWPFGRDVFVSLIYDVLKKEIPGIDFVADVMLSSRADEEDNRSVSAAPIWHESGDLVGLRIREHHLPTFDWENTETTIVIAPSEKFLKVNLTVRAEASDDPRALKTEIRKALRERLHPAHRGPKPGAKEPGKIFRSELKTAVRPAPGASGKLEVDFSTVPASATGKDHQRGPYIQVEAGEVLDCRVVVDLSSGASADGD